MHRTINILAGAVLVAGTVHAASAADRVRLSVNRSTQAIVAEVAARKGFYEAEGLDVKNFAEDSASKSLQAVVSGSVDFAVGLHTRVLQGLAKNLPLCVVAMVQYGLTSKIVVPVSDKSSKSMADLKGKRLAIQVGSGTYSAWLLLVEALGLAESDFVVKHMRTRVIPAAFESGDLEVAVAWEPYASIMVSKGLGRVLISNDEWQRLGKIVYPAFLYGNCGWIDENRDTTQRLVNAWIKAMKFINSDRAGAVDVMEQAYDSWGIQIPRSKLEAGIATTAYDKLRVDAEAIKDSQNFARVMYEKGKLKKLPDFTKALRPEFAEKALSAN